MLTLNRTTPAINNKQIANNLLFCKFFGLWIKTNKTVLWSGIWLTSFRLWLVWQQAKFSNTSDDWLSFVKQVSYWLGRVQKCPKNVHRNRRFNFPYKIMSYNIVVSLTKDKQKTVGRYTLNTTYMEMYHVVTNSLPSEKVFKLFL